MGGVVNSYGSNITIEACEFHENSAAVEGGVLHTTRSTITIGDSNFTKNTSPIGTVIYATASCKIDHHNYILIDNNSAIAYAVIFLSDSEFIGHDSENVIIYSNNLGSLVAFNSNITFIGNAIVMNITITNCL